MSEIQKNYKLLIEENPQFAQFVKEHKHMSDEDMIDMFGLSINKEQD